MFEQKKSPDDDMDIVPFVYDRIRFYGAEIGILNE